MNLIEAVKQLQEVVKRDYPDFSVGAVVRPEGVEIDLYRVKTYEDGTEMLRVLGVGKRNKNPQENGDCYVSGKTPDGFKATAFCSSLPPTCRIVMEKVRIPKTKAVEVGEFIEVETRKVICSDHDERPVEPAIEAPKEAA